MMDHDNQDHVSVADADDPAREPTTFTALHDRAHYTSEDFISYFWARNRNAIGDDKLEDYLANSRCIAVSHALFSGTLTQNAATWYVREELQDIFQQRLDRGRHWSFPGHCVELVTHVSRLFHLPANVSGRPACDKVLAKRLSETYKSERGTLDPTIWRLRVARFTTGSASQLFDVGPTYREHRDFDEYIAYWRAATPRILHDLLGDRRFCAHIDALVSRQDHKSEISPILSTLDDLFAHRLEISIRRLRHRLYWRLAGEVECGVLRLPKYLRDAFPEAYAITTTQTAGEPV